MAEYLVKSTAVLGPPHSIRTFYAGECVSPEDFADEEMFARLLARGALVECAAADRDAARKRRAELDVAEFGFVEGTEAKVVESAVAARRRQLADFRLQIHEQRQKAIRAMSREQAREAVAADAEQRDSQETEAEQRAHAARDRGQRAASVALHVESEPAPESKGKK